MKSRGLSIFLYILTFFLIFFVTGVVTIHSYYFIPYSSNGIQTDRAFPISYLFVYGFISIIFSLIMTYSFLSVFGKYSFKEVFQVGRKKILYISSFATFGIVYFMIELLVGYIVLNYGDPNSFINGNNSNSVVITSNKAFNNINYSNYSKKTNMFTVNGNNILSFNDSNIVHGGSGEYKTVGINTIINASDGATVNGNRLMLTIRGHYTEGIYLKDSSLNLSNSNFLVEGNYSVGLFGDNSNVFVEASTINSNSNYLCVFRNGSDVVFDSTNFVYSDNINQLFYLSSDSMDIVNKFTVKETVFDNPGHDLFRIDNSKDVINLEVVTLDWLDSEDYILNINNADVELNIKQSKVYGNINLTGNSTLKINLINSNFFGHVMGNEYFDLSMDGASTFNSSLDIKLNSFSGSEAAFENLNAYGNHVYIGSEIKK